MTKKLMSITVQSTKEPGVEFSFSFYGDPKYHKEWWDHGLEVYQVVNTVPGWMPLGLVGCWCFVQDIFNFKNPFKNPIRK